MSENRPDRDRAVGGPPESNDCELYPDNDPIDTAHDLGRTALRGEVDRPGY